MAQSVSCFDCGNSYEIDIRKRCECGEPLWIPPSSVTYDSEADSSGVDGYVDQLPVNGVTGLGVAAGGTPLIRAANLDEFTGCRLHVKDEGENPTGSFKDRGSAVGIAYANANGRERVGTVSHGNMAMSMSALSAGTGTDCVVLVPNRIPGDRLKLIAQYGPTLVQVEGKYAKLYDEALEVQSSLDIEFVNSDGPLRVEGQKTIAYEIFEAFDDVPDGVVLPVSSGGNASAVWKGFRELKNSGVLGTIPRLFLVQTAACDPIAEAYREEEENVRPVEPEETIAFSISNGSPPSGNRALRAVRATGGAVISVTDDEIREATSRLASEVGLCVETASATTVAGLRRLKEHGSIERDDDIVALATGTGFKEFQDEREIEAPTISISNFEEELASVME